ncbi:class I SAM-dependent methyltransferase [Microbacterium immunditiarum]|uniref:SAM-dependent methyltransferase n=1 Tax=Microbacterium immunditiarum TaxID=337480 RepID=A0A7Y9KJ46_9MICO|nr:class I SAM-dependent methyltransferase [Microbacterium immunditiarum]NYE21247.1 SAM-dependent methyltransferase [Microbacterium immunditiarum]
MSFDDVAAQAYDGFMGRYSRPLAEVFVEFARFPETGRALDVGCGTGALTEVLARRFGQTEVAAADPSPGFVAATAARFPWADVRHGSAEELPFDDDLFDATLAELVFHFMTDAAAGAREMVRVTRPGGVVAACVWDLENARGPYSPFLRAVEEVTGRQPPPPRPGTSRGDLVGLLTEAGCRDVVEGELTVEVEHPDFDEWWHPHTLGIGSTSGQLAGLDEATVASVRERAHELVGDGPIRISATAWAARGIAP